jgi:hypothetical protein
LLIVLAITGTVFVAEVIGGLLSGSLALLADARHILTDSTGLLLAVLGASLATRAATAPHLRPAAGRGPGRARQPVARVCVHAPRRTSTPLRRTGHENEHLHGPDPVQSPDRLRSDGQRVERGLAHKPSRRLHLDVPADNALAQRSPSS